VELLPGVRLFPVYHCSPRVLAATRKWDEQRADWRRIGVALGRLLGHSTEPTTVPGPPKAVDG